MRAGNSHARWAVVLNGAAAVATLLAGWHGYRAESAWLLAWVATPCFAILALAFGIAAVRDD